MGATAANEGTNALGIALRATGIALLAVAGMLAFVFAAAAALVIGLIVTGAAIAMRFAPRRRSSGPETLDARQTPSGWVVETSAHRAS